MLQARTTQVVRLSGTGTRIRTRPSAPSFRCPIQKMLSANSLRICGVSRGALSPFDFSKRALLLFFVHAIPSKFMAAGSGRTGERRIMAPSE